MQAFDTHHVTVSILIKHQPKDELNMKSNGKRLQATKKRNKLGFRCSRGYKLTEKDSKS